MDLGPSEILEASIKKGKEKGNSPIIKTMILATLAGMFIGLGYLAYLKSVKMFGSDMGHLLGSFIFPMGLVMILMGGGELFTGNVLDLWNAYMAKKVSLWQVIRNWIIVFIFNSLGAVIIAFAFSHLLQMGEGPIQEILNDLAHHKVEVVPWVLIVSGIGCNILVAMAVWMASGSKQFVAKVVVLWMPVMAFVYLGFQHSVANMFLLPASYFASGVSLMDILYNIPFVIVGNILGGVLISLLYTYAYRKH